MYLFTIRHWHFYAEVKWNIWLFGLSWDTAPDFLQDFSFHLGPLIFQLEHYKLEGLNAGGLTRDDDSD
jgi:hypothetical protein